MTNFLSLFRENQVSCDFEGFLRLLTMLQSALWVPVLLIITELQLKNFDINFEKRFWKIVGGVWGYSIIWPVFAGIMDLANGEIYFGVSLIYCCV